MAEEKADKAEDSKEKRKIDPSESPVFVWDAQEFSVYQKGGSWTLIIIVVALALIGTFYFIKNWTGIVLVVAAVAALISQGGAKPKTVKCAIFDGGVVINNKPYNFGELKAFWLLASPHLMVRFEKASRFSVPVTMPLGERTDPEQVRLFLLKRLPEHEDRGEDVSDRISRWMRF